MKPKRPKQENQHRELFRPELVQIIDLCHEMVKLAGAVEWDRFDELFDAS
jgi:hypothetical protein